MPLALPMRRKSCVRARATHVMYSHTGTSHAIVPVSTDRPPHQRSCGSPALLHSSTYTQHQSSTALSSSVCNLLLVDLHVLASSRVVVRCMMLEARLLATVHALEVQLISRWLAGIPLTPLLR